MNWFIKKVNLKKEYQNIKNQKVVVWKKKKGDKVSIYFKQI